MSLRALCLFVRRALLPHPSKWSMYVCMYVCAVTLLKEHSHDFTYRAQMIVPNVYNATIDDLRRCTFFGRQ